MVNASARCRPQHFWTLCHVEAVKGFAPARCIFHEWRTKIMALKTLRIFGTEIRYGMNSVSPSSQCYAGVACYAPSAYAKASVDKRRTEPKP